jgi:tetratricopeptide (TPR) repeat protein
LFATAALMARKGRYDDASQWLRDACEAHECSGAEALDLQARICAQQGMLTQAEACWIEALRQDPSNPAYTKAIARLRRSQNPLHRVRAALWIAGAAAVAVAVLVLGGVGYRHVRQRQDDMGTALVRLESSLNDLRTAHADGQRASHSQVDAVGREVRQSHAETDAAIATLPALSHVDDQFRQVSTSLGGLRTAQADARRAGQVQFDAVNKEIHQSRADMAAAIARLPESSHVDEQFRQAAAATQAALGRIVAESSRRDGLLAAQRKEDHAAMADAIRGHSDVLATQVNSLAAMIKAGQDRQAQSTRQVADQIERHDKALATLDAESAVGREAVEKRIDQSVSGLRRELALIREEIDRLLWFRWPVRYDESPLAAPGSSESAPAAAVRNEAGSDPMNREGKQP